MINKFIKILQQVEKRAGLHTEADHSVELPYKRFGQVWIRADKPIGNLYAETIKHSELPFYPETNYKAWAVWLLKLFKLKKDRQKFGKLLGLGLNWHFLKTEYFPLRADIIYYRRHAIIMIYASLDEKKVVKVALSNWGKVTMKSEIASQRLASSIKSKDVFIPSVIAEFHDGSMDFTIEEYFAGKRLTFKDKKALEANFHKVFQFLMEFYLKNPIELQYLSKSKYLNHNFVEEFVKAQDQGENVISIYKRLYAKKKQMILCRIHGDLNHNNILLNKDEICIIDWGKSKLHYLSRDLDNSSYDTEGFYKEFMKKAKIDESKVYSYKEQLFLGRFIEMSRRIHNKIKHKTITTQFYSWTKYQNELLIKMGEGL